MRLYLIFALNLFATLLLNAQNNTTNDTSRYVLNQSDTLDKSTIEYQPQLNDTNLVEVEYFDNAVILPLSEFYTPDNLLQLRTIDIPLYYNYIDLQFTKYSHRFNKNGKLRFKSIGFFGRNIKGVILPSLDAMVHFSKFTNNRVLGASLLYIGGPAIHVGSFIAYLSGYYGGGALLTLAGGLTQFIGNIYITQVSLQHLQSAVNTFNKDLIESYQPKKN